MKPQTLLAGINWISLIILVWLLVLSIVPGGGIQIAALVFFFVTAMVATVHDPESAGTRKPK